MSESLWTSFIANNAGDQVLVCPSFDGVNWLGSTDINKSSKFAPSLATFHARLYVAFIANNSGNAVLVCSSTRAVAGDVLLFSSGHFIRVLADRWLALTPGCVAKYLLLGTASLSALSYDHTLSQPVIRLWNDDHQLAV